MIPPTPDRSPLPSFEIVSDARTTSGRRRSVLPSDRWRDCQLMARFFNSLRRSLCGTKLHAKRADWTEAKDRQIPLIPTPCAK